MQHYHRVSSDIVQPRKVVARERSLQKKNFYQRFKEMYKSYWYVVLPVHMVTSAIWFGSFYYAVRSGVDAVAILQYVGVSDTIIAPLKESKAGYFAFAFALYKMATPLRYTVTLGSTTYAIRKLTEYGWIRPVPSTQRIKEMIQEKKDDLQDRFSESKQHYQHQMKAKHTQIMEEMKKYKNEIRNKVKKKD